MTVRRYAALAASVAVLTAAGATPARATPPEPYYKITALHSGLAVTINDLSTHNNEVVRQRTFDPGSWNHHWTKTLRRGVYTFRTHYSRQCMSVAGASRAPGASIVQRPCFAPDQSQQWTLEAVRGNTYVKNVRSGLVLTVASRAGSFGHVFAEGTELVQDRLTGTSLNQFFSFEQVARG
jgi:hypothetical protein